MKKNNKKEKNCFKIIFQSTNARIFRSTLIGYFYEIAQKHKVILMLGEPDPETEKILGDKNLFPGLVNIIFFEQPFYGNIFNKNYKLSKISKEVIQKYKPDIVIAPNDIWPAEMYLLRFAKKAGALTIAVQEGFKADTAGERKLYFWSCLMNSHLKMPKFLPFSIRMFFVKLKKYFGHFFYYWILPLTVGEMPFLGKTSFVFWDDASGLRADYSLVFSERDYKSHLQDNINPQKLFIIGHPLEHKTTKEFFEKVYFSKNEHSSFVGSRRRNKEKENAKTLTIMWPEKKIGIRNDNYSLISEDETRESRIKIIKLISEKLPGWKIFIKPHPRVESISEIKKFLGEVPNNISITEPSEPADKYIEMSKVIVGVPPPSTTILTTLLQCPQKIILSLNLDNEFFGDDYKNFAGVEYIDNKEKLFEILTLINDNKYSQKNTLDEEYKQVLLCNEQVLPRNKNLKFSDTAELLNFLYNKQNA